MATGPEVAIAFTADSKEVTAEIKKVTTDVTTMGRSIDASNEIAVRTWKKAADSAKEYLNAVGATQQQHWKLDGAIRMTETRIDTMAEHYARAGERGEKALSNLMRTGELTGRSMNSLISAAGDLGLAFSPAGAVAAGISMMAVAIGTHMEKAEEKLQEVADKFSEHVNNMLADGSAVEAAKASARAYIHELEAISKIKRDEAAGVVGGWKSVFGGVDLVKLWQSRGHVEAADIAHTEGVGTDLAASELASIEVHDKRLKELGKERKLAHEEIARAEERIQNLDAIKNKSEIAALKAEKRDTERRLADLVLQAVALEGARRRLVNQEAAILDPATAAALRLGAGQFKEMDVGAEAEAGERGVEAHSGAAATGRRRDAAREKARIEAKAQAVRDRAARDEIEAMGVRALEAQASHVDVVSPQGALSELAVIEAKREQERKKIEEKDISNQLKAQMQAAADALELAEVQGLNQKIEAENKRHDAAELKRIQEANKKENAAIQLKIKAIERAETQGIDAMLSGKKDIGRRLLRIALEPEIRFLEAKSAEAAVISAADFAEGNWAEGARYALGASIFAAGAASVAALAGAGGGGSGGGGGGGGGGPQAGAGLGAQFGAQRGTSSEPIKIEFVMIQKDQTGREVARTRQMIQRLEDQNTPIRVTL